MPKPVKEIEVVQVALMGTKVKRSVARSLSVRSKLIISFVSLTLLSVAVVSWIGYVSARQSLQTAAERQLMGLQRSTRRETRS